MNFGSIQQSEAIRWAAIAILLMLVASAIIIMTIGYIVHGSGYNPPALVYTIMSSAISFAIAALSSHQGATINQQGTSTGAGTLIQAEVTKANPITIANTEAMNANTEATNANTKATTEESHG